MLSTRVLMLSACPALPGALKKALMFARLLLPTPNARGHSHRGTALTRGALESGDVCTVITGLSPRFSHARSRTSSQGRTHRSLLLLNISTFKLSVGFGSEAVVLKSVAPIRTVQSDNPTDRISEDPTGSRSVSK